MLFQNENLSLNISNKELKDSNSLNNNLNNKEDKQPKKEKKEENFVIRTLHFRLKNKHKSFLLKQAYEVNQVWNYVQQYSLELLKREGKFSSRKDLHAMTVGVCNQKELGDAAFSLHSQTVQGTYEEYLKKRKQFKKKKLNWRVSNPDSPKYSLGWVPIKAASLQFKQGQVFFMQQPLSIYDSYGLTSSNIEEYKIGPGSFSEDSRGRWFLNITVKIPQQTIVDKFNKNYYTNKNNQNPHVHKNNHPFNHKNIKNNDNPFQFKLCSDAIGIDKGLDNLVTFSDGTVIQNPKFYKHAEEKLKKAQQKFSLLKDNTKNNKEINNINKKILKQKLHLQKLHQKVANCRKEFIHQLTTQMVKHYTALFLGNAKIQFMIEKNNKSKNNKKLNKKENNQENQDTKNINIENKKSKTKSKSAHDAGWGMFTTILQYKSNDARRWFLEISEAYSTQTCSKCLKKTGPKGEDELHVKEWTCSHCHTQHHRDVNAAINILNLGLRELEKLFLSASRKDFSSTSEKNLGTDCPQSGITLL